MNNIIKRLLKTLTSKQKKQLYILQLLVVFSSLLEVLTILVFGPFMTLVGNTQILLENPYIKKLYSLFRINSNTDFLIIIASFVLLSVLLSSIFSIITIRKLSFFAAEVGSEFGDRLYTHYMSKSYIYHSSINSADIIKKIATEVGRVTDNILQPVVQINARIATVIFISFFVILYNPMIAIFGVIIISLTYYILFGIVKNRLSVNGKLISITAKKRFKLLNEGFNAIKEIQILGREDFFITKFKESGKIYSKSYGSSNSLYNIPRYIIEFILFFSMVILVLFFLLGDKNESSSFLPIIAVFGIASLKLLPSFQQIYSGLAQIRSNTSAFDSINDDLINSLVCSKNSLERSNDRISGNIKLENVYFNYPDQNKSAINGISLEIPFRSKVGIVGPSGSGKSTLIDIIMRSIDPIKGELYVGDVLITSNSAKQWRNNIGYVSQMPLILDASIANNIAFGINKADIDLLKLENSIKIAQIDDWIKELPDSYDTIVGERGMKISGGQRQRIAIARAFYHNTEYLFFDEATSSLDTITENNIMKTVEEISGMKTIVMIAHRLNTVKNCDWIYIVTGGKIKAEGTYKYLIENDNDFSLMAGVE
jgi:ABC-type multidrug transport system fused ATPase/permease subunit